MQKLHLFLMGIVVVILAGCGRSQGTIEGDKGEKLTISPPDTVVSITQGKTKKFSLTVVRKNLDGPVEVEFEDLPEGLTIVENDRVFGKETSQKFFTLKADKNAKPQEEVEAQVTASYEGLGSTNKPFTIKVVESLESKAARKKAFLKKIKDQLTQMDKDLKKAGKIINTQLKDIEKKAQYSEQYSGFLQDLAELNKRYQEELEPAPPETWERHRDDIKNTVDNLQNGVSGLLDNLKNKQ